MKPALTKAVFPVAGMGTRFLPATKASPKEMLPVVDKPLIQYAVEEAYEAGIREMIFVTGRSKRAIEDHFDTAYELETELEAAGKHALLEMVRSVQPSDMQCVYVRQARALGLGHAVLCAEHLVGDAPFAVLLADDLMQGLAGGPGVLKQMAEVFARTQSSVLAVQEVPLEQVHRYGIVAGRDMGPSLVSSSIFCCLCSRSGCFESEITARRSSDSTLTMVLSKSRIRVGFIRFASERRCPGEIRVYRRRKLPI